MMMELDIKVTDYIRAIYDLRPDELMTSVTKKRRGWQGRSGLRNNLGDLTFQDRQLVLDDIPYDLAVDPKVFMDQNISHPGDLLPSTAGY